MRETRGLRATGSLDLGAIDGPAVGLFKLASVDAAAPSDVDLTGGERTVLFPSSRGLLKIFPGVAL